MSDCFRCERDTDTVDGCLPYRTMTFVDGQERHPVPVGAERWADTVDECEECDAAPEAYHHPGCSVEQCPRCGHRYATCDCDTKEKRWLAGDHDIKF